MFRNYLKIAWRNLWKSKTLTLVNIMGLAVAFAAGILLYLTAFHELSYDKFHVNKEHLYELYTTVQRPQGPESHSNMPAPLTPALQQEFPEIKAVSRNLDGSHTVRYGNRSFGVRMQYVDEPYLQMFTFPIIKGEQRHPLGLGNVVITKNMAEKLFGHTECIGKQVSVHIGEQWKTFIVSAVVADFPDNSSLQYDVLCRFENNPGYARRKDDWNSSDHEIFLQLADNATPEGFERRSKTFVNKYFAARINDLKRDGGSPSKTGEWIHMHLIPITEIHFNSISSSGGGSSRFFPYMLLLIAAFILFIACINFINLTIARAFARAREIGMRKILGALRLQLIAQLWGEALLVCLIALVTGAGIAYLLLPAYNALFSNTLSFARFKDPLFLGASLLVFGVITLLAGGYPALLIARLNTIKVLKGAMAVGQSNKVRNLLMVVQFSVSALLICCTLIAWQQLDYMRRKPLGYDREQVISIPISETVSPVEAVQRMRSKLADKPGVISVTAADLNLGRGRDGSSGTSVIGFDYKGHEVRSHWLLVDYDYVKTLGLQLVAGRDFSPAYGADSTAVVINEKMAAQLGGVQAALGAMLAIQDSAHPSQVIGIVKNFHFKWLKDEIAPLTLSFSRSPELGYIFIKVRPDNLPGSMELVKQAWLENWPGTDFNASFLDENINRQYRGEERFSKIFISAAVLSILISCMGLFAISVLVMTQRTREIGVRKVLGASVASIVALLSRDFIRLVLLSILIAAPVAWYAMEQWLRHYAYRIPVNVWIFLAAGGIAILIALLTVSIQSVRAALMNPVKSIRTE